MHFNEGENMNLFSRISLMAGLIIPCTVFAAAGDVDVTFGSGGVATSVIGARKIALQPADGKLLAVGTSSYDNFQLARYYPDGTVDLAFGSNGVVTTDIDQTRFQIPPTGNPGEDSYSRDDAFDVAVQADGKILVAGYFRNTNPPPGVAGSDDFVVVRYTANGVVDTTFGVNGVAVAAVLKAGIPTEDRGYALAVQADGKIVVTGEHYEGTKWGDFVTVRFTSTGAMDTTFAGTGYKITSLSEFQDTARDVVIQADGKIVVVGDKSSVGTTSFGVVRYNANGTPDTTFGPSGIRSINFGSSTTNRAYNAAVQSNGKLVVGGYSYTTATNTDFALARFNTNGTLDTTFDGDGKVTTHFGGSEEGYDVLIQGDGKIVMVGSGYVTNSRIALARYNTNGSLDTTFGSGGKVMNAIQSGAIDGLLQNGKIVTNGLVHFLTQ
jgi:uncharacterized delta-60 repeat protein